MKKLERLQNITNYRMKLDGQERIQKESESLKKANYLKKIKELQPRVKDLLDVARELDRQGFKLGDMCGYGSSATPIFVSDGIAHRFGFLVRKNPYWGGVNLKPFAIGIEGGGCNGANHAINEDADFIEYYFNDCVYREGYQYFIDKFNKLEKDFYEYVDKLTTQK